MDQDEKPEEIALDLEGLLREAEDEQAGIRRLEDRIAKFVTAAALEEFPALKNMTTGQIREFGDAVSRAAAHFALKAADLAGRAPGSDA